MDDPQRHEDSKVYRMAAIRECFEESGILLAKKKFEPEQLLDISSEEIETGRHATHKDSVNFQKWVADRGGFPDIGTFLVRNNL